MTPSQILVPVPSCPTIQSISTQYLGFVPDCVRHTIITNYVIECET